MKILVPTDGSEQAMQAVSYAANFAEKFNAEVSLIYVTVYETRYGGAAGGAKELDAPRAKEALDKAAAEFAGTSVSPEYLIRSGSNAALEIILEAEKGYDQIIMSSKGKSNMKRFFMGSVSDSVVHHAPCTVTIVR